MWNKPAGPWGWRAMTDSRLRRVQEICDAVALDHFGADGGRIEVVGIDGPAAQVRLHGACASCMGPNRILFLEIEALLAREGNGVEYLETTG